MRIGNLRSPLHYLLYFSTRSQYYKLWIALSVIPIHNFLTQVEIAVNHGLPLEGALDVITVNAAKAIGLEDRLGKLESGYDADVVLMTTPPGAPGCKVVKTIIDGEVVWEV